MKENFDFRIVSSDKEYAQAMDVRRQVFVDEHKIPEFLEYDGNDHSSTHVLALDRGKPVGTMRIRYFNGFVKFERMCVLPDYRKTDVSEHIMRKGMVFAATKGYDKVYGVCKKELLPRWKKNGFEPIKGVNPVSQNGMTLVPVSCSLPTVENQITINTPAEILNAREGEWDFALQKQTVRDKLSSNIAQMLEHVRMLKRTPNLKIDPKTIKYIGKNSAHEY